MSRQFGPDTSLEGFWSQLQLNIEAATAGVAGDGVTPGAPAQLGRQSLPIGVLGRLEALGLTVDDYLSIQVTETAALAVAWGLDAPFEVMDFHWYNSDFIDFARVLEEDGVLLPDQEVGVQQGRFLYLSRMAAYVNGERGVRETLRRWWANGGSLPLWCSETGISSHKTWDEFKRVMTRWSDLTPDCDVADFDFGATTVEPQGYYPEFRVDPVTVKEELGLEVPSDDLTLGNDDGAYDNYESWPEWAFTSEQEQARQVWMRLSYVAALGVDKAFWWAYLDLPWQQECGTKLGQFYAYGLTLDTEDIADATVAECGGGTPPGCVTATDPAPLMLRRKKQGYCALRRWNQYLDRYVHASFVKDEACRDLDGNAEGHQGFYAVVIERDPASARAADYPYAVVLWADAQAYDWGALGAEGPPPSRVLTVYVHNDDPSGVPALRVATVPSVEVREGYDEADEEADPICHPCLDAGEAPIPDAAESTTGYLSPHVLRFAADAELAPDDVHEVQVVVDADPVLLLLPATGWVTVDPSPTLGAAGLPRRDGPCPDGMDLEFGLGVTLGGPGCGDKAQAYLSPFHIPTFPSALDCARVQVEPPLLDAVG